MNHGLAGEYDSLAWLGLATNSLDYLTNLPPTNDSLRNTMWEHKSCTKKLYSHENYRY